MTVDAPRPPLREFLTTFRSRTGDTLEAAALAEMTGYSIDDARAQGWSDLFAAAEAHPVAVDRDASAPSGMPAHARRRALIRGLTYTAPVLALWSIFPRPATPPEIRFLALLVVLSWGGSMASSHVVGSWLPGNGAKAWRIAGIVAATAVYLTAVSAAALMGRGLIGPAAAALGAIQVLYFFSASPLMLRDHNPGLGMAALVGAAAGVGSLLATYSVVGVAPPAHVGDWLRTLAAACLMLPGVLLLRQLLLAARAGTIPGYSVVVQRRDVAAFGFYGVMFGCLVLWVPIVNPSSPAAVLNVVVIGGIALAEVAVTRMRQRADALLRRPFDAPTFVPRARRIILGGILAYVLPVGVATVVLAWFLSQGFSWDPAVILAGLTVLDLGAIQVLSLIGMSLHGIRHVSLAITACSAALIVATPLATGSLVQIELYLGVLTVLGVTLLAMVLRLGSHPINFL